MTATLVGAIDRLIEANAALRKRRALSAPERQLAAAMHRAFRAQGRAFLARFARLAPVFPPAIREVAAESDWGPLFDDAALATIRAFTQPLDEVSAKALQAGMLAAVADLGVEADFTLEHPAAVDYLKRRGAERVTQITGTTRDRLRTLLTRAAAEGWGYGTTAAEIKRLFAGFTGPPKAVRVSHLRSRAEAIAVFETGDAYEHGNVLVARDLQAGGLEMQKSWLTVGDHRVRPDHRQNQAQGWIPLDDAFADGSDRPPTDPGCRCTLLMRRKPSE